MHHPQTPLSVKPYQEMLLRDAQGSHQVQVTQSKSPRPWERMLANVGEFMIRIGSRLQERYKPALSCGPEACPPAPGKASV
jgi:hypothetical protein